MTGTPRTVHPFGTARVQHTATRLADGRVLLLGGQTRAPSPSEALLKEASVWSPATGSWSAVKPMGMARMGHTATLLADGRVLVAGGENPAKGTLASAEVWDPKTDKWKPTGKMEEERSEHVAVLLEDGRVLVVGGGASESRAEVWDPRTGQWQDAGQPAESRRRHTATRLADGRVLVAGGETRSIRVLATSEVWDPVTGEWRPGVTLAQARESHTATLLPDGRVLLVGGFNKGPLTHTEVLDVAAGSTRPLAPLARARRDHSATLLPDGRVLVAGGQGVPNECLASVEVWRPEHDAWQPGADLEEGRGEHTATLLEDGRVLLVGGYAAGPFSLRGTAELWGEASAPVARPVPASVPAAPPEAPTPPAKAPGGKKRKPASQTAASASASPDTAAKRAKAAKSPTADAAPGYHFDRFARAVATDAVERLAAELDTGERVDSLRLLHDPLAFWPEQAVAVVEGREVQLELDPAREGTHLPPHVDAPDTVREALVAKYPELAAVLSLSGLDSLPGALWHASWHDVAEAVREELKQQGLRTGPRFQVHASTFEEADVAEPGLPMKELVGFIQEQLRRHFQDDERLREFAERCYLQPQKRAWLQRLRDA